MENEIGALAAFRLDTNESAAARTYAEEAVRMAEGMGDEALLPSLDVLFRAQTAAGDFKAGRATANRALAAARRLGSGYRLFFALRNAAVAAWADDDRAGAESLLLEAAPFAEALDRSRGGTRHHDELAMLRQKLGIGS